jgi:hypothetical protein
MSSLKSIISSKSANSAAIPMTNVLPAAPPVLVATRKNTPEPISPTKSNGKKKDLKEKRKRNNSWIANSFRKAFGKEKKKSSENDEDNNSPNDNPKSSKTYLSRRACASDDENQIRQLKSSFKRDSDSDYDDNYNKLNSKSTIASSKIGKRTYRSESELLDENEAEKSKENVANQITNCNNGSKKALNFNNYNTIQNFKSCSSIVTSTNSNEDTSSTNSRSIKW